MKSLWVIGFLIVFVGCKTAGSGTGASSVYSSYQEDLSSSLPQYADFRTIESVVEELAPLESGQAVDDKLASLNAQLVQKNKAELYFSGYTILVFSGIDRDKAFNTRDEILLYYPSLPTEMQYQEPRYLVKVGRYGYKFEAQKNFSLIKSQFSTARIIQDRFLRNENLNK